MKHAMRQAESMYDPKTYDKQNGIIIIDFNRPVGDGFMGATDKNKILGIAGEYRWTNTATVGIDPKTGKAYTAFPNMDEGYKQENKLLDFIKK